MTLSIPTRGLASGSTQLNQITIATRSEQLLALGAVRFMWTKVKAKEPLYSEKGGKTDCAPWNAIVRRTLHVVKIQIFRTYDCNVRMMRAFLRHIRNVPEVLDVVQYTDISVSPSCGAGKWFICCIQPLMYTLHWQPISCVPFKRRKQAVWAPKTW